MKKRTKRQKAIIRRRIFLSFCAVVLITLTALIAFVVNSVIPKDKEQPKPDNNSSVASQSESKPKPIPESYATIINIGDIMCHSHQLEGAKTGDGYDFSGYFKELSPYFQKSDLAIGNLELTFGGSSAGSYRGYPSFNTPDQMADAIKSSGINLLMTANNHSYDTGLNGLIRTAQVLKEKGIQYTGTRETADESTYIVKNVNNIKIGIVNFTYETVGQDPNRKYLNGAVISKDANPLINTFSYQRIDTFYSQAQEIIKNMKNDGAEYIAFYMHWGEEYKLNANTWQKSIAQSLSNMGVNMIVGGHPHVVEPMELIHSEDGQTETVCIYSLGNAVSNQRRELMKNSAPKGHTEDGAMFTYKLKKSSDGSVSLIDLDIIPTWVHKYSSGGYKYTIYPIENLEAAKQKYPAVATKLNESYQRTKAIVQASLTECQKSVGCEITFK